MPDSSNEGAALRATLPSNGSSSGTNGTSLGTGGAAVRHSGGMGQLEQEILTWVGDDPNLAERMVLEELAERPDFDYSELPDEGGAYSRSASQSRDASPVRGEGSWDAWDNLSPPISPGEEVGSLTHHRATVASPMRMSMMRRVREADGVLDRMVVMESDMYLYDPLDNREFLGDKKMSRQAQAKALMAKQHLDTRSALESRRGVRAKEVIQTKENAAKALEDLSAGGGGDGGLAAPPEQLTDEQKRERLMGGPRKSFAGRDAPKAKVSRRMSMPSSRDMEGVPEEEEEGGGNDDKGGAEAAAEGAEGEVDHDELAAKALRMKKKMKKITYVERVRLLQSCAHGEFFGSMGQDPRPAAGIPVTIPLCKDVYEELKQCGAHAEHVRPFLDEMQTCISRHWRGFVVRRSYQRLRKYALIGQRNFRASQMRRLAYAALHTKGQIAMSRHFKGHKARKEYKQTREAAITMQKIFRGRRARKDYNEHRAELREQRAERDSDEAVRRLWEETAEWLVGAVVQYHAGKLEEEQALGGWREEKARLLPFRPPSPDHPNRQQRFYGVPRAHVYAALLRGVEEHHAGEPPWRGGGPGGGARGGGWEPAGAGRPETGGGATSGLGSWAWAEAKIGISVERWERDQPPTPYSACYSFSPRGTNPRPRGPTAEALAAAEAASLVRGLPSRGYVTLSGRPGTRPVDNGPPRAYPAWSPPGPAARRGGRGGEAAGSGVPSPHHPAPPGKSRESSAWSRANSLPGAEPEAPAQEGSDEGERVAGWETREEPAEGEAVSGGGSAGRGGGGQSPPAGARSRASSARSIPAPEPPPGAAPAPPPDWRDARPRRRRGSHGSLSDRPSSRASPSGLDRGSPLATYRARRGSGRPVARASEPLREVEPIVEAMVSPRQRRWFLGTQAVPPPPETLAEDPVAAPLALPRVPSVQTVAGRIAGGSFYGVNPLNAEVELEVLLPPELPPPRAPARRALFEPGAGVAARGGGARGAALRDLSPARVVGVPSRGTPPHANHARFLASREGLPATPERPSATPPSLGPIHHSPRRLGAHSSGFWGASPDEQVRARMTRTAPGISHAGLDGMTPALAGGGTYVYPTHKPSTAEGGRRDAEVGRRIVPQDVEDRFAAEAAAL